MAETWLSLNPASQSVRKRSHGGVPGVWDERRQLKWPSSH